MPHLFLNVRNANGNVCTDFEGENYSTFDKARTAAVLGIKEKVADTLRRGGSIDDDLDKTIEILDESGQVIMTVPFAEGTATRL